MLLKTVDSLMRIWDCGLWTLVHNLIDDCVGMEGIEYQDYLDPSTDPDYVDKAI
jgi:hypothetical protein